MPILSREQCRAARALLDWSQDELAKQADVKTRTVNDFERGARNPLSQTKHALRSAMEAAGIQFIAEGELSPDGGAGVRLRKEKPRAV